MVLNPCQPHKIDFTKQDYEADSGRVYRDHRKKYEEKKLIRAVQWKQQELIQKVSPTGGCWKVKHNANDIFIRTVKVM